MFSSEVHSVQPGAPNGPTSSGSANGGACVRLPPNQNNATEPVAGVCTCIANAALPRCGRPSASNCGSANAVPGQPVPNGEIPVRWFCQARTKPGLGLRKPG